MLEGLEAYSTYGSGNQGKSTVITCNDEEIRDFSSNTSMYLCICLSMEGIYYNIETWNTEKNGRSLEGSKKRSDFRRVLFKYQLTLTS